MNTKFFIPVTFVALSLFFSVCIAADEEDKEIMKMKDLADKTYAEEMQNLSESYMEDVSEMLPQEQGQEVSQYFNEATKNYDEILQSRPRVEAKNTNNRIVANTILLRENKQKLIKIKDMIAAMQQGFSKQLEVYKSMYRQKLIEPQTYQEKVQQITDGHHAKMQILMEDEKYYTNEVQKTEVLLKKLHETKRLNQIWNQKISLDDPDFGETDEETNVAEEQYTKRKKHIGEEAYGESNIAEEQYTKRKKHIVEEPSFKEPSLEEISRSYENSQSQRPRNNFENRYDDDSDGSFNDPNMRRNPRKMTEVFDNGKCVETQWQFVDKVTINGIPGSTYKKQGSSLYLFFSDIPSTNGKYKVLYSPNNETFYFYSWAKSRQ